ncbi:MAG TPA: LEA type 2 family protein [Candidatus Elarobacter sp.]|nr:LEA type 2 family protein [Candidatus Elarobacter sp.]
MYARRLRIRRMAYVAGAALATLSVGCRDAARNLFKTPVVSLRDVRVRSVGFTGTSLDVYLGIQNSNPYSLEATGANYRLLAGDSIEVGRGTTSDTASVAAHDSTVVHLPIDVQWQGLGAAGMQALVAGSVDYRVTGTITLATPVGGYALPVDARGHVKARR